MEKMSAVAEVETELINTAHTNVLLLQQLFTQAEKWHLNLDTDLSQLENRELLESIKAWEESDAANSKIDGGWLEKKKLAPLNEGGPAQLLNLQIQKLEQENSDLRTRLRTVEEQASSALEDRSRLKSLLEEMENKEPSPVVQDNSEEIKLLSETVEAVKNEFLTEKQELEHTKKNMEQDLTSAKHRYLEVQHQLTLAEKELEKKFSETGAYKNLKKMLSSKNETIKELRRKLITYEPEAEEEE
ncbi:leucine zipper transcription factor-like protein 1 [Eurytemora carolleeae]|uniref:leucine zipper transcription factor-like protein 1 n=1 Tax=Eurytemora carolleeae TaxID=1294199 RepID=UPI000C765528|nr:leucine zipper transcription factor-like protein 1 [Eurytemora carolleeae]|eukprot:XP_023321990.1 leucine zipper transcription factor-like protein 1 [Eurytemora affinis]